MFIINIYFLIDSRETQLNGLTYKPKLEIFLPTASTACEGYVC